MSNLRCIVFIAGLPTLVACSLSNPCPPGLAPRGNRCASIADAAVHEARPAPQPDGEEPGDADASESFDDAADGDADASYGPAPSEDATADDAEAASPAVEAIDGGADRGMDAGSPDAEVAFPTSPDGDVFDAEASDSGSPLGPTDAGADAGDADGCTADPARSRWLSLQASAATGGDAGSCVPSGPSCAVTPCPVGACTDGGPNTASCSTCIADAGAPWPRNEVPICFTPASAARADLEQVAQRIWDGITTSWSAVADVEFIGWYVCPADAVDVVPIDALPDLRAAAHAIGYQGLNTRYAPVEIGTSRRDFASSLVPHLTGHLLGLDHEPLRPQTSGIPSAACQADSASDSSDAGSSVDQDSIMSATDDCQSSLQLSRWDIVNARKRFGSRADNVVSTGSALYARKRSTGDIYVLQGSSWSRISGPVGQLAAAGAKLYALTSDLSEILAYGGSGTLWTRIGFEALEIVGCAADLCATLPSGDFVRYRAGSWSRLGGPATKYVATASAIYRLSRGRYEVEVYSESDARWYHIGDQAGTLYATSTMLLATNPQFGDLHRYTGENSAWEAIGYLGRVFVGVGATLYSLNPFRDAVQRYTGSPFTWGVVGSSADWIYGAPDALYMTEPVTKDILRYNGQVWERLGQP